MNSNAQGTWQAYSAGATPLENPEPGAGAATADGKTDLAGERTSLTRVVTA